MRTPRVCPPPAAILLLFVLFCITSSRAQTYLICKRPNTHDCITWQVISGVAGNSLDDLPPAVSSGYMCGFTGYNPRKIHRKFLTIESLNNGLKKTIFCKRISEVDGVFDWWQIQELFSSPRIRREATFVPRGKYRGQTQSQYLAIDRGNGKDEGKAEAHSAADSSRASVSGNSGMGQAQSQSIYDPSCDDCYGKSGQNAESLQRRPGGADGYGKSNWPGHGPGYSSQYGGGPGFPSQSSDSSFGQPVLTGRDGKPYGNTYAPNQYIPGPSNRQGPNELYGPGMSSNGYGPGTYGPGTYSTHGTGGIYPDSHDKNGQPGQIRPNGSSYGNGPYPASGGGPISSAGSPVDTVNPRYGSSTGYGPGQPEYILDQKGIHGAPSLQDLNRYGPVDSNSGSFSPGKPTGTIYPTQDGSYGPDQQTNGKYVPGQNSFIPGQPKTSGTNIPSRPYNGYRPTDSHNGESYYGPDQRGSAGSYIPGQGARNSHGPNGALLPPGQLSAPESNEFVPGSSLNGQTPVHENIGALTPGQSPISALKYQNRSPTTTYIPGQTGPGSFFPGQRNQANWPLASGPFLGPDGINYVCCVVPGQTASGMTYNQNVPGNVGGPNNILAPGTPYGPGNLGSFSGPNSNSRGVDRPDDQNSLDRGTGGMGPSGKFNQGGGSFGAKAPGEYYVPGTGTVGIGQNSPGSKSSTPRQFGQDQNPVTGPGGENMGGQSIPYGSGSGPRTEMGGSNRNVGPGGIVSVGGPGGQFGPSGTNSGMNEPGRTYGAGSVLGGPGGQYVPDSGVRGSGGQYIPTSETGTGKVSGPEGQYIPTSGIGRPEGQYLPGSGVGGPGGKYVPYLGTGTGVAGPQGKYGHDSGVGGPREQYLPGSGEAGSGGQYVPNLSTGTGVTGTGGQYIPGSGVDRAEGQYVPGSGTGLGSPGVQYVPGSGTGVDRPGDQYFSGASGPRMQYGPGINSNSGVLPGKYIPGVGSGTSGPGDQYGPTGITNSREDGPGGQLGLGVGSSSGVGGPGAQYGPRKETFSGISGPGGQYSTGSGHNSFGVREPNSESNGSGGQFDPGVGSNSRISGPGQLLPGSENGGPGFQYVPGGRNYPGISGSGGQFTPGSGSGPGIGGPGGQYAPGSGASFGTGGPPGQYVPGGRIDSGTDRYEDRNSPSDIGNNGKGGTNRQFGPGSGTSPGGDSNLQNNPYGNTASNGGPSTGPNPHQRGTQYGSGGPSSGYNGVPQNYIDPNSITDGDDSEAEAVVSQAVNGTTASAASKGGNAKGRAQTHVQGTYTGSGSFQAQAQIAGENKEAESAVSGGKKGASSSATGSGRNNKSQASVQLGSETGAVQTNSQSSGAMHSSNSQVQGSVKGGMADAQARGPGSTSSQAQIGFTPYKDDDKAKHDLQQAPFVGGGIASAQSSGRTGQSQSQLHGTFKYGIRYNGAAQAGSSLDKDAVFPNRLSFEKMDVFDDKDKNINVDLTESPPETATEKISNVNATLPELSVEEQKEEDLTTTEKILDEGLKNSESKYDMHPHADHHKYDTSPSEPTLTDNRRSFHNAYNNNGAEYEYTTDKDENDDYDSEGAFIPEGPEDQGAEYSNYDEYPRGDTQTHQSLQNPSGKGLEVRQTTGGNTQHILLGSLKKHDAEITQKSSERPDEKRVYQPGERVPGTGGYTIPMGFTGSVKSVASKDKTYVVGSRDSPSQAQTVTLTPGTGKVRYTYPSSYSKYVHPTKLRSLHGKSDDDDRYVSVSKSVTRALDNDNNIRKQYSHTYYTKSSSCGYFTFTCTMVSGAEGKKKVCKPKIPTNPDGTPIRC